MSSPLTLRAFLVASVVAAPWAQAADPATDAPIEVRVQAALDSGAGAALGSIRLETTPYGVKLTPMLDGLPPGVHGMHLHEKPSCDPAPVQGSNVAAMGAGGHLDPAHAGHHTGPWAEGHLGDLPALFVDEKGHAASPVVAPRLHLADFHGHAIVIHAGGDNYADSPAPLGGGGRRIACGVVP